MSLRAKIDELRRERTKLNTVHAQLVSELDIAYGMPSLSQRAGIEDRIDSVLRRLEETDDKYLALLEQFYDSTNPN